jgi:hypothetical protein
MYGFYEAKEPLYKLLGELKAIHDDGAHRLMTGITPIAIDGESMFKSARHITRM